MKKVLFVIGSSLVNAGVPNVIMKIVRALHRDYVFDIIVGDIKEGFFDREFLSYGGHIFRYSKITYGDGKLKVLLGGFQTYKFVREILNDNYYDIVHSNDGYMSGWILKAAAESNIKVRIAHSHGSYLIKGKNIPLNLYKWYSMKMTVSYSTHRLACSDAAGKTLFLGQEFLNVLNPIEVNQYLSLCKEPHDELNIIQIGYYCRLKNQIFTIKVLKKLLDYGINARVHFIGYDNGSGYLSVLIDTINQYDIEDKVIFYPSNANKLTILPKMDFLLLPSSSEGLPLTALEAQASRTYCIASTHVPEDCDMGMFYRINVDSSDSAIKCADWIIKNYDYKDTLNVDKISKLSTHNWASNMAAIYENALGVWGYKRNIVVYTGIYTICHFYRESQEYDHLMRYRRCTA